MSRGGYKCFYDNYIVEENRKYLFKWKLFIFFVESDTMKTFTSKYNQAKWPSWTVCF